MAEVVVIQPVKRFGLAFGHFHKAFAKQTLWPDYQRMEPQFVQQVITDKEQTALKVLVYLIRSR